MKIRFIIVTICLLGINLSDFAQKSTFIGGAFLNFNGIHTQGEALQMYSSDNGTLWGCGGISAGISVRMDLSKKMYSAVELRYSRKGSLYEYVSQTGNQAFEGLKLDYAEIPIIIGYKSKLKNRHISFEGGLAYGKLIRARLLISDYYQWDTEPKVSQFKKDDLSCFATMKYPLNKNENLFLGFRFSHSFFSVHKNYRLYNMNYGLEIDYLLNRL